MQATLTPTNSTDQRMTPEKAKWIIIACAIYLALPIDVIPGVGLVGDLTAFFLGMHSLKSSVPARREN